MATKSSVREKLDAFLAELGEHLHGILEAVPEDLTGAAKVAESVAQSVEEAAPAIEAVVPAVEAVADAAAPIADAPQVLQHQVVA